MKRAVGRLRSLRLLNQMNDARDRVVGGGVREPDAQHAVRIDAAGIYLIADALRDRDRLAGTGASSTSDCALDHLTVGRHPVARTNHDDVAHAQALNGHLPNLAGLFEPSDARHEIDQSFDARPGTPRCDRFQKFADRKQEYDDRCLFGGADRDGPGGRHCHERLDAERRAGQSAGECAPRDGHEPDKRRRAVSPQREFGS